MRVSAIVSNFNGARFLPKLLETLRNQRGVEVEIVIVNRNSTDGSQEILAVQSDIKVVQHPPETGLVSGYSAGYRVATNDLIFFCNEDMWFDEHCLTRLAAAIDLDKRIAVADPWQWSYDGERWIHGITRFHRTLWNWNSPYPFRKADFCAPQGDTLEVPFPCAGALMVHRAPFEEVGGWDTRFFLDLEDVNLGLRLWKTGWKSISVPEAKVYHAVGASNAQVLKTGKATKTTVRGKRYIGGRANVMFVQLKHLSLPVLPAVGLLWSMEIAKKLLKGDLEQAKGAVAAGGLVAKHLPDVLRERRAIQRRARGLAPFFEAPAFQRS